MPFIPIPNTVRCELRFTQDSQQVANIFHVWKDEPLTVGDLNTIGAVFVNWWSGMSSFIGDTVTFREIDMRDQSSVGAIGILYNTGLPITGTAVGAVLPNHVTAAIKWGTGLTGRSYRGRTYHIGLTEGQVTDNELTSLIITDLLLVYNELISDMTTAGYSLVVASRYANNAPRTTGIVTPILTAAFADVVVDSQRKRLPGRGR